jgi:hypothetical protein
MFSTMPSTGHADLAEHIKPLAGVEKGDVPRGEIITVLL